MTALLQRIGDALGPVGTLALLALVFVAAVLWVRRLIERRGL
jgi:hypothetical protein